MPSLCLLMVLTLSARLRPYLQEECLLAAVLLSKTKKKSYGINLGLIQSQEGALP